MNQSLRMLIVDDSEDDALLLIRRLQAGGYEPIYQRVCTREEMEAALATKEWDIIICDYVMPGFGGPDALKLIGEKGVDLPVLIVSGAIGEEMAVAALKSGANDFIMKDNLTRLIPAIEREIQAAEVRRERKKALEHIRFQALVLSQVHDAVIATDNDKNITYMNPAAEELYGVKADDMVGKPIGQLFEYDWLNPEDERLSMEALEKMGCWRGECMHIKQSSGKRVFVETSLTVLNDVNEAPIGFLAVVCTVHPIGI